MRFYKEQSMSNVMLVANGVILITILVVAVILIKNKLFKKNQYRQQGEWIKDKYTEFSKKYSSVRADKKMHQIQNHIDDIVKELIAFKISSRETADKNWDVREGVFKKIEQIMYIDLIAMSLVKGECAEQKKYTDLEIKNFKNEKNFKMFKHLLEENMIRVGESKYNLYLELKEDGDENINTDLKVFAKMIEQKVKKQKKKIEEDY